MAATAANISGGGDASSMFCAQRFIVLFLSESMVKIENNIVL